MPYVNLPYSLAKLLMPKYRKMHVPEPQRGTWIGYLEICTRLARAIRQYHSNGLCHSDLSLNNALVNPTTGQMTMIDLDGLVVEQMIPSAVDGTPGFIAPEVVLGQAKSSINADKHALAVMIFRTLLFRHPLCGKRKFKGLLADQEERMIYGEKPLYTDHPKDISNRPGKEYVSASNSGPFLEALFARAFVEGLIRPEVRPLASDWESALLATADLTIKCKNPACQTHAFALNRELNGICPFCGDKHWKGAKVPVLCLYRRGTTTGTFVAEQVLGVNRAIVCFDGKCLTSRHFQDAGEVGILKPKTVASIGLDKQGPSWRFRNHAIDLIAWTNTTGRHYCQPGQTFSLEENTIIELSNGRVAVAKIVSL
ncbi:MAG: hypothetical protein P4L33_02740 [Capsulimonadaceae bacterium]|nr:hypothetical protein [Capsulimonadaceae bacterium]